MTKNSCVSLCEDLHETLITTHNSFQSSQLTELKLSLAGKRYDIMIQEQSQATFAEYKTQIYTYASKMVQLLYLSPLCCTGSTLQGTAWNIGYIQLSQRKEYSTETV